MVVVPGSTAQLLIAILIVLFFMLCVFKLVRNTVVIFSLFTLPSIILLTS
jgi:hypothetical protein